MSTISKTKYRGISFSAEMIRAILDGRKTQTRRVAKPQPPEGVAPIRVGYFHPTKVRNGGEEYPGDEVYGAWDEEGEWGAKFPYGVLGDRLYVKETWQPAKNGDTREIVAIYRVDWAGNGCPEGPSGGRWRSARFMPKRAARIWLEITGVRVERLDEITQTDAMNEGTQGRRSFTMLWDEINGPGAFGKNPWVWVIEFKRLELP